MRRKLYYLIIFILLSPVLLRADSHDRRSYTTVKVGDDAIQLDGKLTEAVWHQVEWQGDFIQRSPREGEPPTFPTEFKILYDDDHLYLGVRAHDPNPGEIDAIMSRRDHFPGDWVEINIDSRFDKQTAFSFTASVSGVKGDEFISLDGDNWDGDWNPIWDFETHIDDKGWTMEARIPYSQLRFGNKDEHTWGIQVARRIYRHNERSMWQEIPTTESGWVHHFGELKGLKGIRPKRQIELLPYAVAKTENFEVDADNPFTDGKDSKARFGLDGKVGLTDELTMNFTVNPDFGQVEADPSEVNLSAFETFFSERRPFFVEDRNIFSFQVTSAVWGGSYSSDRLFYSRRIGGRPHHYPDGDFVDFPDNSSIVGALKITGKTKNGLSIGILNGTTAEEKAEIDTDSERYKEVVEPLTNFFVGRVQQDFKHGNTIVGAMMTATNRSIDADHLNFLHESAYTGGLDFQHFMRDREFYLSGNVVFSQVNGDEEAILDSQLSSRRYFQRPDAAHVAVDSSKTSLSGHGGTIKFGRSGNFRFQTGVTWRSPELELNDMGFQRTADEINEWTWVSYRFTKPFGIINNMQLNANTRSSWDTDGNGLSSLVNYNMNANFKNNWSAGGGMTYNLDYNSNSVLRGGPAMKLPGSVNGELWVNSDHSKRVRFGFGVSAEAGADDVSDNTHLWFDFDANPTDALAISWSPWIDWSRNALQYVESVDFNDQDRYIFGEIDQTTVGMTVRLNYSITPDLTVEYYGSPFVAAGEYDEFKRITDPKADAYDDRFSLFDQAGVTYNDEDEAYDLDETGDGTTDYSIDNPDFNFRDFNSNLVVRWEYMPGSTLFLVWSQARSNFTSDGRFDYGSDVGDLFGSYPNNVFLIKVSRWINL